MSSSSLIGVAAMPNDAADIATAVKDWTPEYFKT
jgi:hypothetical protein